MFSAPTFAARRFVPRRSLAFGTVTLLLIGLASCSSSSTDDQVAQSGATTITSPAATAATVSTVATGPTCDEVAIADAFDASGQSPSTSVSKVRCVGTWAVADISTVDGGTTDATNLFQANGLVWVAMGDVVPPDAETLHMLGVPTEVAAQLLGDGNG